MQWHTRIYQVILRIKSVSVCGEVISKDSSDDTRKLNSFMTQKAILGSRIFCYPYIRSNRSCGNIVGKCEYKKITNNVKHRAYVIRLKQHLPEPVLVCIFDIEDQCAPET